MKYQHPSMTEKQLQSAVVQLAELLGYSVYPTYDSRRSQPGFPDLVLCRPPRLLFVELKTTKGKLTAEQKAWGERLIDSGAEYRIWRPSHWNAGAINVALGRRGR